MIHDIHYSRYSKNTFRITEVGCMHVGMLNALVPGMSTTKWSYMIISANMFLHILATQLHTYSCKMLIVVPILHLIMTTSYYYYARKTSIILQEIKQLESYEILKF